MAEKRSNLERRKLSPARPSVVSCAWICFSSVMDLQRSAKAGNLER